MNSLYLISNASIEAHNKNTLTKFVNVFEAPLRLPPGQWQVTLDTIILNPVFANIPLDINEAHIKLLKRVEREDVVLASFRLSPQDYTAKSLITEITRQIYLASLGHLVKVNIELPSNESVFKAFREQTPDFESMSGRENITEYAIFQKRFYKHNSFLRIELLEENLIFALHASLGKTMGLVKYDSDIDEYLYVRESFTCKYPFKFKSILPKYLNIELADVDCNMETNHRNIISTHALEMIAPNMHYKHFEQAHYGTLTTNVVRNFKVRILDDNYKQLRIGIGQPSILKMNFRQYDINEGSFFLTIKSGKNKSDFTHVLQPPIHLDGDYVCALTSITYPARFNHIPLKDNKIYMTRETPDGSTVTIVKEFNPDNKKISTVYEMIHQINADCSSTNNEEFGSEIIKDKMKSYLLYINLQENNLAGGSTKLHLKGLRHMRYDFPGEIGLLLGQVTEADRWQFIVEHGTDKEITEQFIPSTPMFNLLVPHNMFLYSNFTDLVYMGGNLTSLMHIVPIRSQAQSNYATEEVRHLNFIQVRHTSLNNLKFQLLTAAGDPISFERTDDTVSITLKFMRKNK
jgi:hypothetical protein